MYGSIRLIAVAACAVAVTGFLSASPAGAGSPGPTNAAQVAHSGAVVHPNVVLTTTYGNGYFSYPGAGNVVSASVTFTAPAFSCAHPADHEWLSPGIWVFDTDGALSQFSAAEFNCNAGTLFQGDVICVDSYATCDTSLTINPGDRVVASLFESSTQTYAKVRNLTTGLSSAVTGAAVTNDYTVFLGDLGPSIASVGAVTKIPTYSSSIHFTKAQVNGMYLSDWSPAHYNLKTSVALQETSSSLTGDGDAFTATFRHN